MSFDLDKFGIYRIINSANNFSYIGSTSVSFAARWQNHQYLLNSGKHNNGNLQQAWNNNGGDCFVFEVVEYVADKDLLADVENYWINKKIGAGHAEYNRNAYGTLRQSAVKSKVFLTLGKSTALSKALKRKYGILILGNTFCNVHVDDVVGYLCGTYGISLSKAEVVSMCKTVYEGRE